MSLVTLTNMHRYFLVLKRQALMCHIISSHLGERAPHLAVEAAAAAGHALDEVLELGEAITP